MASNDKDNKEKVAMVTGSSSGIGFETALTLARNGFLTYATMRNLAKSDKIKAVADKDHLPIRIVQLDVTDDTSVNQAVQSIIKETGRIDILVNNAGYALSGAFEDLLLEEIKNQYDTNFYGIIRTSQAVLPIMRKQRSGRIINISSGLGLFGFPGMSAYSSTKFAMEGLSESMAYELDQFGINVILIEPGVIRTNIGTSIVIAKKAQDPRSPYSQMMQKMGNNFKKFTENASSVDVVANVVLEAATNENPCLRYLAGKDMEMWMQSKNSMSDDEFYNSMKKNLLSYDN
ncbi:MAG TPA: SDR family oxidoreductase [Nitrososphaeraceae archaeon]|nr:SDR family oxidoreductase [Nitrososphaeraceae archaeon]